jgi:hypothetical protein
VIYLSLEDPKRVTKAHLRMLGAQPEDDLYIWNGPRPDAALAWLEGQLAQVNPVLVVVDTMQHLLGVSDLNDYARVVVALGPVLALVRPRQAHLMLLHHAGKGDRSGFDAILGSTGILGTVDTALLLRRRDDNTRTLATRQRTGEDLPESVLVLDDRLEPRIEGTRADYDAKAMRERVREWLTRQTDRVTREAVETGIEGRAEVVRAALYALVEAGEVERTGEGKRGAPYLFGLRVRLSSHIPGQENTNPQMGQRSPNDATFSCPVDPRSSATPTSLGTGFLDPDEAMRAALRDGA